MRAGLTMASLAVLGVSPAAAYAAERAPSRTCESLKGFSIPAESIGLPTGGATIVGAVAQAATPAGVPAPDHVPAHCDITGVIRAVDASDPPINFKIAAPLAWNGHAFQMGGGGANGFIPALTAIRRGVQGLPPHAPFPIASGYATYGGDSGHSDKTEPAAWVTNKTSYRNFAREGLKKTHDAAFAVLQAYYGVRPARSYFSGESQGGREALAVAAYYPADYDGVISGVPLTGFAGTVTSHFIRIRDQLQPGAWLPPAKAPAIAAETLRVCDPLDGLKDGVISNYAGCERRMDVAFTRDPMAAIRCPGGTDVGAHCLSDAQMATLNRWRTATPFGVPFLNGDTTAAGLPVGSEDRPGWIPLLPTQPDPANPPRGPAAYHMLARYADRPTKGDLTRHTPAELRVEIAETSALLDVPADLSAFFARGGKLIVHAAANDYLANSRAQMRFHDHVVARHGQAAVDRAVRFYVTPYAPHAVVSASASGEPLPRYADLFGALTAWVETGRAPGDLVQTLEDAKAPYTVTRSRPLCRYPDYPRYKGQGDPKLAASYACAAPGAGA